MMEEEEVDDLEPQDTAIPKNVTRRLFISHFLSTWNSRVFEFGAVLYLATIFPNTLLPMSVYALTRGAAAILFSPLVGRYVDRGNRLEVVRWSIVLQRVVVAVSCVGFWILASGWLIPDILKWALLALLSLISCIEKLSAIMNLVAVEKDWVVVVADENETALRALNSQMRRIDLFCKLVGPFVIALIDGYSTQVAILVNLGMNVVSVGIEYFAIAKVYELVPNLQTPKHTSTDDDSNEESLSMQELEIDSPPPSTPSPPIKALTSILKDLTFYTHHPTFLPSLSNSLIYLTVLSFSGQMITYLLSTGLTSTHIALLRTLSVLCELSATYLAPILMSMIGPIRSGIWFISSQSICLLAGTSLFLLWLPKSDPATPTMNTWATIPLITGTILSRIGLWGFDLSVQIIIQEEVSASHRGTFSSVEAACQNFFELCSFALTIVFSRPEQFQVPVVVSCGATVMAAGWYAVFVRKRRGHLVHLSRCIDPKERGKRRIIAGQAEDRRSGVVYERLVSGGEI